jgi:hypothetical protein
MATQTIDRGALRGDSITGSKARLWAGRVLSAIPILFLTFDAVIKLIRIPAVSQGMTQLGYPVSLAQPLGIVLLACVLIYALPRTAVLGAVLLTGYLGGAIATHVRVGDPLFSHVLFPVYVALMLWGGIYLRDERVRALLPLRSDR